MTEKMNSAIVFTHSRGYVVDSISNKYKEYGVNICTMSSLRELYMMIDRGNFDILFIDTDSVGCNDSVLSLILDEHTPTVVLVYRDYIPVVTREDVIIKSIDELDTFLREYSRDYSKCDNSIQVQDDISNKICEYLLDLGICSKYQGFQYVVEIQTILYRNYKNIHSLATQVYPIISSKYYVSTFCIDKNIRHLIKCTWLTTNKVKDRLFDGSPNMPSARVFLFTLAHRFRVQYDEKNNVLHKDKK